MKSMTHFIFDRGLAHVMNGARLMHNVHGMIQRPRIKFSNKSCRLLSLAVAEKDSLLKCKLPIFHLARPIGVRIVPVEPIAHEKKGEPDR